MQSIDHEYTHIPVCPYCGEPIDDMWDLAELGDGDVTEFECGGCGREFQVMLHVRLYYSTSRGGGEQ